MIFAINAEKNIRLMKKIMLSRYNTMQGDKELNENVSFIQMIHTTLKSWEITLPAKPFYFTSTVTYFRLL